MIVAIIPANIDLEIKKSSRLIKWLIDGYGVHCIPPSDWKHVTIEWVVKCYNVEMGFFIN